MLVPEDLLVGVQPPAKPARRSRVQGATAAFDAMEPRSTPRPVRSRPARQRQAPPDQPPRQPPELEPAGRRHLASSSNFFSLSDGLPLSFVRLKESTWTSPHATAAVAGRLHPVLAENRTPASSSSQIRAFPMLSCAPPCPMAVVEALHRCCPPASTVADAGEDERLGPLRSPARGPAAAKAPPVRHRWNRHRRRAAGARSTQRTRSPPLTSVPPL